mgnify:CR=1 FL=1
MKLRSVFLCFFFLGLRGSAAGLLPKGPIPIAPTEVISFLTVASSSVSDCPISFAIFAICPWEVKD